MIEGWTGAGHLPALAGLYSDGTFGWLEEHRRAAASPSGPRSTPAPLPVSTASTSPFSRRPAFQGYQRFHQGLYGRPSFWRLLGDGDPLHRARRAITQLEDGFGCQVIDWGTWAHYLGPTSTPASLLAELRRACGDYPLGLEANDIGFMPIGAEDMRGRLMRAARAKAEAALWLMRRREWDLFFVVFDETHPAAHYCWSPSDVSDGGRPSLLREIYGEIDRGIRCSGRGGGPDASVLVVSGDAVGPSRTNWYLLPDI